MEMNIEIFASVQIKIDNFLGTRIVRKVRFPEGTTVKRSDVKDELLVEGNDLEDVSQAAANIHQVCLVRNKDIRKFLDGIYVSAKGHLEDIED